LPSAVALKPELQILHSNLLLTLHYDERIDPQVLLTESLQWARRHGDPLKRFGKPHTNDRNPERRLKVGYVSYDFRTHSVSSFLLPLLAAHDPEQIEIFCYSYHPTPDAVTDRIRGYAHQWRNVARSPGTRVAEQIRQDQIDILIDLAGHTYPRQLTVFASKPAPVQVAWLGYPNTTGLDTMDYRLTDAIADPPGASDKLCSEKLIRLPRTAWCYEAPYGNLPLDYKPPSEARPITFGCFNAFPKINRTMLELWATILRSIPASRMLIKAKAMSSQTAQQKVRQVMEGAGIASDRLEMIAWKQSRQEHLSSYQQMDIALDTFPYHGTTTTCEALWMGVPVVTLEGQAHVSRVGVSLLSNMGLSELVAISRADYARIAIQLAGDTNRLNELLSGLRQRMRCSPLMDAPQFARDIERAFREIWRNWCNQIRPSNA
jgi:protein O-GlcNAc transferase